MPKAWCLNSLHQTLSKTWGVQTKDPPAVFSGLEASQSQAHGDRYGLYGAPQNPNKATKDAFKQISVTQTEPLSSEAWLY